MAVCRLVVEAFKGTDVPEDSYDDWDLQQALNYAGWMIEGNGIAFDEILEIDLSGFANWLRTLVKEPANEQE